MSTSMNMAITIFGFVLSALFIMVICCRLLCSRIRNVNNSLQHHSSSSSTWGRRLHAGVSSAIEQRTVRGLEPSVIACFPTIKYHRHVFISDEDNVCSICLGDYKERDVLRILPSCGHAFHVSCIDMWLGQNCTCPVCRMVLRTLSECMHMSAGGPLISLSARVVFVPGALPDHVLEQPNNLESVTVEQPTSAAHESLGRPVKDSEGELETGEASTCRCHVMDLEACRR